MWGGFHVASHTANIRAMVVQAAVALLFLIDAAKGEVMIRTTISIGAIALFVAGCVSSRPEPAPVPQAGAPKQIRHDGGQLVLPDGTRVTPDSTGGFQLPNGDYVRRDRSGALILPTGARCAATPGGYTCP